jgi:hypothetical protein
MTRAAIKLAHVVGNKGRGVVACRPFWRLGPAFKCGALVERCPLIGTIKRGAFEPWEFWRREYGPRAYVYGGLASLYNHSAAPNVRIVRRLDRSGQEWLCFYALRAIWPGEELCFDYGYDPAEKEQR